MKQISSVILFLSSCLCFCQNTTHSIYLIGDAGEYTTSGEALLMLKKELLQDPNSTVLFLGDNVYPQGLKLSDTNSVLRLTAQLQILKEYRGNIFFIPGNHDWAAQKAKGRIRIITQQHFVESYTKDSTTAFNKNAHSFLPQNALPGPESVLIKPGLRIIFIDTQWFLHFYKKNKIGSIKKTKTQFYNSLDSLLEISKQANEQVVIAAHHPIYTNGQHSKKIFLLRLILNFTPFKIFSWLGFDRSLLQYIDSPTYKRMRKQLITIFDKYNHITYVSGHDHNLQYLKNNKTSYIVSGCGSKLSKLRKKKRFDFVYQSDDKTGFVKIHFEENKNQKIEIYKIRELPFCIEK